MEKACEIGIDQITPVRCQFTERTKINNGRLEKVLISAMKQSGNLFLPVLAPLCTFDDFLEQFKNDKGLKYLAFMGEDKNQFSHNYQKGKDVLVMIGPEGGFSLKEIGKARKYNFDIVSLGESRLRTETAGVFVCSTIKIINQLDK